jgi:hypothetical protein
MLASDIELCIFLSFSNVFKFLYYISETLLLGTGKIKPVLSVFLFSTLIFGIL